MSANPNSHILQSLAANGVIAVVKGVAAFFTGSGSMAAETIHSVSDCANQLLLLLGVKQAKRPADALHPLGYGRSLYFWSFMVAMLLFTGGGVFSFYEGVHKVRHPAELEHVGIAIGILLVSLLVEGAATLSNVREMNKRRGKTTFYRYLRDSKDSDLVVVFGENAAASLGLMIAAMALAIAEVTGDPRWDGGGSIAIGVVLIAVAIFLAREVQSLLVGESADVKIAAVVEEAAREHPQIHSILRLITIQQGPGEVLVLAKVQITGTLTASEVCAVINEFEAKVRDRCPEARWFYVEPGMV